MTQNIHPTAYIAEQAVLGKNITVGPFAVIESPVQIGDNCKISAHAVVMPYTKMGSGNILHPQVVLGDLPQDISFQEDTVSWLVCGNDNVFREGFTAHRASEENGTTLIGSNCFFMNNSHVAHDCRIGNHTIFANSVAVGGFAQVDDHVFMGGSVVAHQFCRIGSYAIIRGTTALSKDALPFCLIAGSPAKHYRLNTLGLRRAGITGDRYKVISTAFRRLRKNENIDDLENTEEIIYLKQWLAVKSIRGLHGFMGLEQK